MSCGPAVRGQTGRQVEGQSMSPRSGAVVDRQLARPLVLAAARAALRASWADERPDRLAADRDARRRRRAPGCARAGGSGGGSRDLPVGAVIDRLDIRSTSGAEARSSALRSRSTGRLVTRSTVRDPRLASWNSRSFEPCARRSIRAACARPRTDRPRARRAMRRRDRREKAIAFSSIIGRVIAVKTRWKTLASLSSAPAGRMRISRSGELDMRAQVET